MKNNLTYPCALNSPGKIKSLLLDVMHEVLVTGLMFTKC